MRHSLSCSESLHVDCNAATTGQSQLSGNRIRYCQSTFAGSKSKVTVSLPQKRQPERRRQRRAAVAPMVSGGFLATPIFRAILSLESRAVTYAFLPTRSDPDISYRKRSQADEECIPTKVAGSAAGAVTSLWCGDFPVREAVRRGSPST